MPAILLRAPSLLGQFGVSGQTILMEDPLYLHIIFPMMFIDFSKKLDSQERHLLTILKALLLSSLKK